MKKRKGFTLIEMLIVTVIIGILMMIGMGLSWSSLEKLKVKSVQEDFVGFFDSVFLQINGSNYHNGKVYSGVYLYLSGGNSNISYKYYDDQNSPIITGDFSGKFQISTLTGDTESLNNINIKYKPFSITCEFFENQAGGENSGFSTLSFSVKPRGKEDACFLLKNEYCKLQAVECLR